MENPSFPEKLFKFIGVTSVVVSVLSIPMSAASGVGVIIAAIALILSGCSSLLGNTRYLLITFFIVTFNLLFVSVFSVFMDLQDVTKSTFMLYIGIPYIITFTFYGIGVYKRRHLTK